MKRLKLDISLLKTVEYLGVRQSAYYHDGLPCNTAWAHISVIGTLANPPVSQANWVYFSNVQDLVNHLQRQEIPFIMVSVNAHELDRSPLLRELVECPSIIHIEGKNPYHDGQKFINKIFVAGKMGANITRVKTMETVLV